MGNDRRLEKQHGLDGSNPRDISEIASHGRKDVWKLADIVHAHPQAS